MMLNRSLYNRLKQSFGEVDLVNEDQPIVVEDRLGPTRAVRWKLQSGEQYRVDCPFCGDTRGRLYISYAWGMDSKVRYPSSKLVVCHNEHCEQEPQHNMKGFLERKLNRYFSDVRRGLVNVPAAAPASRSSLTPQEKLEFPRPEWCIPLDKLGPAQDSVIRYLRDQRKFDLGVLSSGWGVTYAYEYPVNRLGKDYSWLAGRLFIPVYQNGSISGWQARVSDETSFSKQKYFNCPGWKKSAAIYNIDNARRSLVGLMVEGVTDVWRVGGGAFSTFGKTPSPVQIDMIAANWEAVGVMYDPDTDTDKQRSAEKAIMLLRMKIPKVFRVHLPDGRDPADCSYNTVWNCIERDAARAGVSVERPV